MFTSIKRKFHIDKEHESIMSQTNNAMIKINELLASINKIRWMTIRSDEFSGKSEILNIIEDMRFLCEDALRRVNNCKLYCDEYDYDTAKSVIKPVDGQIELVKRKHSELLDKIEHI